MTELEKLEKDLECKKMWLQRFIESNDFMSMRKTEESIKEVEDRIKRLKRGGTTERD